MHCVFIVHYTSEVRCNHFSIIKTNSNQIHLPLPCFNHVKVTNVARAAVSQHSHCSASSLHSRRPRPRARGVASCRSAGSSTFCPRDTSAARAVIEAHRCQTAMRKSLCLASKLYSGIKSGDGVADFALSPIINRFVEGNGCVVILGDPLLVTDRDLIRTVIFFEAQ